MVELGGWSSLVAQWVKELVLPLLCHRFNPRPWELPDAGGMAKKKKKKIVWKLFLSFAACLYALVHLSL